MNAPQTDAELLQRALAGDEAAFLALYGKLKGGIFRYAFYITNSTTTAEEVTQEVFVTLLQDGAGYRADRGDVGGFAFGIARNFVRRIERRERPYEQLPEGAALESIAATESMGGELIRHQTTRQVQKAIASLPDHYRQAVVLCDLCELSYEEAAARLQCAVGTIRSRLNRAHALLAQKLRPLRDRQPLEATGTEGCLI